MTQLSLRASNNATFRWTRDLSQFASVYDLASATIRMQARTFPGAPDPPTYQWVTGATSGGRVSFNPTTNLAVFTAPLADMGALSGDLDYDVRLEFPTGVVPLVRGNLAFHPGVTRTSGDSSATGVSGIGDTVTVDGERASSPVPLPLALTAAIAAVEASGGAGAGFNVSLTDAFGASLGRLASTSGAGASVQITDSFGTVLGYAA
jgi:hypothetical protein